MWMACHGQEEIAERESIGQKTVDDVTKSLSGFGNLADSAKSLASHATDFDPPIYNIWKQQNKSEGSSHLGQGMKMEHIVRVWDKPRKVSVHWMSKSVWIAVGDFNGERIEVKARSESAAVAHWREAAQYRGH